VKLVLLDATIAVARLRMGATVVANNSITGVAADPISRRSLHDSDKECAIIKPAVFDSQITFEFGFLADWTNLWHDFSFLKGQRQATPVHLSYREYLVVTDLTTATGHLVLAVK
jgi:hypothetical protein